MTMDILYRLFEVIHDEMGGGKIITMIEGHAQLSHIYKALAVRLDITLVNSVDLTMPIGQLPYKSKSFEIHEIRGTAITVIATVTFRYL